jgi:ataxia telangiectasia mutated family protein
MKPSDARASLSAIEKLQTISESEKISRKKKQFAVLQKSVQPVFRHVSLQQNKSPTLWFDQMLSYSRSVATTSIVGHMFGIGDRHPSNILMDYVTGELVHIDHGIGFDQVSPTLA